ncbi:ATP-binding cassette domain-containing protein, partial [Aerococcaceae bacterium NML171108]|nr:ATP-binding cassette domain-containing protein [Aerococcaceae bacterium NML171108]
MTIQVINGDISINKRVIFENVNLKIMKNCFYRIHGKNGVGKTVLLNTLLGIHPLERGSLSMGYEKKNIVYIPDSNFFFENEKVWDVLNLIKRFYAIPVD